MQLVQTSGSQPTCPKSSLDYLVTLDFLPNLNPLVKNSWKTFTIAKYFFLCKTSCTNMSFQWDPWAEWPLTSSSMSGSNEVSFKRKSPRSVICSLPRFFVKISLTVLKPHSTRYVVGNGNRAFWATAVNLANLLATLDSSHIMSPFLSNNVFVDWSPCNSRSSSTMSADTSRTSSLRQSTKNGWLSQRGKFSSITSVNRCSMSMANSLRCSVIVCLLSSETSLPWRWENWVRILRPTWLF